MMMMMMMRMMMMMNFFVVWLTDERRLGSFKYYVTPVRGGEGEGSKLSVTEIRGRGGGFQ